MNSPFLLVFTLYFRLIPSVYSMRTWAFSSGLPAASLTMPWTAPVWA